MFMGRILHRLQKIFAGGFVLENEPKIGDVLGFIDGKYGGFRVLFRSREGDIHGTGQAKESGTVCRPAPKWLRGRLSEWRGKKSGGWGLYRMALVLESSAWEWYGGK